MERFNPGLGSKTRIQALEIFGPPVNETAKIHSFGNLLSGQRLVVQSIKLQEKKSTVERKPSTVCFKVCKGKWFSCIFMN